MINELRTLLLNEPAAPGVPGEELVDPTFAPRALSPAQSLLRAELFRGAEGDREFRNFLATAFTRLTLCQPDLAPAPLDPRVSLRPPVPALPFARVAQLRGLAAPAILNLGGAFAGDPANHYYRATWELGAPPDDGDGAPLPGQLDVNLGAGLDVTAPIFLPGGTGLFVQFLNVTDLPAGFYARIEAGVPFTLDVPALVARLRTRAETGDVFAEIPAGVDPTQSLLRAYETAGGCHRSLAALLFALGYGLR